MDPAPLGRSSASEDGDDRVADTPLGVAEAAFVGRDVASPVTVARRLFHGSLVYATSMVGTRALGFALTILLTRFLTPGQFGIASLAQNVAAIGALMYGIGLAGSSRLYYDYVDDPPMLRRFVSTLARASLVLTAVVLLAALLAGPAVLAALVPHFAVPFFPYIALAMGAMAVAAPVRIRVLLYQLQMRPMAYAVMSLAVALVSAALTYILVVAARRGAVGLLLGDLLGAAAVALVALILLRDVIFGGWQWRFVREILKLGLPLVLNPFVALGLEIADRFILQDYRGVAEIGVYSLAYTYGLAMYLVTAPLWQAWTPTLYSLAQRGEEGRRVIGAVNEGIILCVIAIGIFGVAIAQDFVSTFLDPRYRAAGDIIPLIIGAYVLNALVNMFGISALVAKRPGIISVIFILAFISNVVFNFVLDPRGGMYGAAYATLGAFLLAAVLMYLFALRLYPWPIRSRRIVLALTILGIMVALTQLPLQGLLRQATLLLGVLVAYLALWLVGGKRVAQQAIAALRVSRPAP